MEYTQAHVLAAGMVLFSFIALWVLMRLQSKQRRKQA